MKKNYAYLVALASLAIATSCSEEEQSGGAISNNSIAVHPTIGKVDSRATETTTANFHTFQAYAFQSGDDKNYMDAVFYNNAGGEWTSQDGTFYWPVTGDLNFYAFSPHSQLLLIKEVSVTPSVQKFKGFTPWEEVAYQQDFIYSKAKGNLADNGSTGVDLNFYHALSEITVQAKNSNTAYTVEVSGVKVGNVISQGDFTFPSLSGDDAAWTLGTEKSDYTTEWTTANKLTANASSLDASNTAFMLLPQQLVAETKASDGSYIALKVKITMQGGKVIYNGWAYVAVPTLWEMGKHYNYIVDFSSGAGQNDGGNDIISGTDVKYNVTVTPWDEENVALLNVITGTSYRNQQINIKINGKSNLVEVDETGIWKYDISNLKATNLNGMFLNQKIKSLNILSLDTHNVTDMTAMFSSCTSLTKLDLSNFETSNVTTMFGMFDNCHSLVSLDLSSFDISKVNDMNNMFNQCNKLETLDVSGWNMNNVTDMNYMFNGCNSLKTIYVVGCDKTTIDKIKSALTEAKLSTDIIKTSK